MSLLYEIQSLLPEGIRATSRPDPFGHDATILRLTTGNRYASILIGRDDLGMGLDHLRDKFIAPALDRLGDAQQPRASSVTLQPNHGD